MLLSILRVEVHVEKQLELTKSSYEKIKNLEKYIHRFKWRLANFLKGALNHMCEEETVTQDFLV